MPLIDWKSGQFKVLDNALADGGAAINDNFKQLCSTAIFTSTTDPTAGDNDQSPKDFAIGSLWLNTSSQAVKILVAIDPATHDATWVDIDAGTSAVPSTRAINTAAPLTGGGDLSADRTLAISPASASDDGSLSAVHYTLLSSATNSNTGSTLVKRDAGGDFSVRNITAANFLINSSGVGISQGINVYQVRVNAHLAVDGLCGIGHAADSGAQLYIGGAGTIFAEGAVTATSFIVGGNQVVGARQAAIADATNSTNVITQLNALLAALRAHGLIAT